MVKRKGMKTASAVTLTSSTYIQILEPTQDQVIINPYGDHLFFVVKRLDPSVIYVSIVISVWDAENGKFVPVTDPAEIHGLTDTAGSQGIIMGVTALGSGVPTKIPSVNNYMISVTPLDSSFQPLDSATEVTFKVYKTGSYSRPTPISSRPTI